VTLRNVRHSAGLLFVNRQQTRDSEASFVVAPDGLHVLADWGYAGWGPDVALNPPADPLALHNVVVEYVAAEDGDELPRPLLEAIAGLVEQHLEKYAECQVWTSEIDRDLADWINAGCVVPPEEEVDGEEEEAPHQTPTPADAEAAKAAAKAKAAETRKAAGTRKRASTRS